MKYLQVDQIGITDEESAKIEGLRAYLAQFWGNEPTDSCLVEVIVSNFLSSYPRGDEGFYVFSAAMREGGPDEA